MKKLFAAAACCLVLTGCTAVGGTSNSTGFDPMESDGQTYVPRIGGSFDPPPAEERLTSSCKMKGQSVQCF